MDITSLRGIIPAVVTPFDSNFNIEYGEYAKTLLLLERARVHGLFIVGNAGEFYALTEEEKKKLLKTTCDTVGGRLPIFFGSGAASTREAVRLTELAESEGADAVSVITPWLIKAKEDELFNHYRTICESTRLPVIVYNNPVVTGNTISPSLMRKLSEIDNIAGIKDSCGDLAITLEFLQIQRKGFLVLAGRDGLILSTLLHGGAGAISSIASACPELVVSIYDAFMCGDLKRANEQQFKLAELRQLFQLGTFPSVVKAALEFRGIRAGNPRPPVAPLSPSNRKLLESTLAGILNG